MRICLISREYPPDTGFGGIATFAHHLASGLTALGHEVEVVALAKGKAKTVVEGGIRVHRVELHQFDGDLGAISLGMPYSCYVLRTATALWEKFYALHCENPFDVVDSPELLAEGVIPAVTKVVPHLIRLYTPHSKFIAEQLHNVTASFDHQFVAMLERVAMLFADVITSPSDDLADFVARDLHLPREKINIIRNPIDADKFSSDGNRAIASDGRPIVLFVGRLEERKGISYLIKAVPLVVAKCPDVRFVIVGDDTNNGKGQRSVLAELTELLSQGGCAQQVEFVPRVPLDQLADYYRSADICVVPSVYDNSPYTCLEAMSCSRPVIGTSAGGTREYIVHGESGVIIPPRDPQAIAESLLQLLGNEQERRRLGDNARSRVLAKYQRTEIARQTLDLYRQARQSFEQRQHLRVYRKPPGALVADAEMFLGAYDQMLYDFLYRQSFRFRLSEWLMMVRKRPRLMLAKMFLRCVKSLLSLTGRTPESVMPALGSMEAELHRKQRRAQVPAERRSSKV